MTIFTTGLLTVLALVVAIGAQTLFLLRQVVRRDRAWTALAVCFACDAALLIAGTAGVGVVAERQPWIVTSLTVGGVVYLLFFAASSFRSALRGERTLTSAAAEADGPVPDAVDLATLTGELPLIDPLTGRVAGGSGAGGGAGRGARTGAGRGARAGAGDVAGDAAVVALPARGAVAVKARVTPRRVAHGPVQSPLRRVVLLALSVSLLNPHAILDTVVMMGTFAQAYGEAKWVYAAGAVTGSALWFLVLGWGGTRLAPYMDSPRTWRIVDAVVGVVMLGIAAKVALTLL